MLFGTYAAQVSRAQVESHASNLKSELLNGNVIHPQEMFDPSLSHPYDEIPPGGPAVVAEQDAFLATLAKYQQPTAGAIETAAAKDAASARSKGAVLVVASGALALACAAAAFFGPAGTAAAIAGAGGGALACGLGAAKNFHKASRTDHFAHLLTGWAEQIANPQPRIAIPASDDAQPFAYVQYVENVTINRRRAQYP